MQSSQSAAGRAPDSSGGQIRDYVYVGDVVTANLAAVGGPTPAVLAVTPASSYKLNPSGPTVLAWFSAGLVRESCDRRSNMIFEYSNIMLL